MAFDLFNSFDIDIPGLFNLLFQTNCSEQVHFLNDEKKLLFTTFTIALYLPFKSPPCVCFFLWKWKSDYSVFTVCRNVKKTSGRFCSYSFILCNLHSRRRFIPLYFLLLLSSTKIWELGLYDIRFSRIFAQIYFSSIIDKKYLAPEIRNYWNLKKKFIPSLVLYEGLNNNSLGITYWQGADQSYIIMVSRFL